MKSFITTDESGQVNLGYGEFVIQGLIVASLVAFALSTLPDLSLEQRHWLAVFELVSIAIFSVEYGVRYWWARPRSAYVRSFFGLVDLLAILPFYIGLAVDLRILRSFRFLRVFRILKLTRYSKAMCRFRRAFAIAREEVVLFAVTACILLYLAAVGIYYFEHHAQPDKFRSLFDGLWWAVATLTTVGYGDAYPVTAGGRFFTFFILMIGLGIISVPAGLVASALSKARREEELELKEEG